MDQVTDCSPRIIAIHNDICIYGQTPEETQQAPYSADLDHYEEWNSVQQQQMQNKAARYQLLQSSIHLPRYEAQACQSPTPPRLSHPRQPNKTSVPFGTNQQPETIHPRPGRKYGMQHYSTSGHGHATPY